MPRYFIEVAYVGTAYAGFQKQQNANTVQQEVEKAIETYFRSKTELTGSSRTDAGVHAHQNFFHGDFTIGQEELIRSVYHLNAILPGDIVIRDIRSVSDDAHCRFDAKTRTYFYTVHDHKNPFLKDRAYYFPYPVDLALLNHAASVVLDETDFTSFSKKNTQVHTFKCKVSQSMWTVEHDRLIYQVIANRFLRGMVRGLVGTMLKVGRGKMTIDEFREIFLAADCSKVDFSVPPYGLALQRVEY